MYQQKVSDELGLRTDVRREAGGTKPLFLEEETGKSQRGSSSWGEVLHTERAQDVLNSIPVIAADPLAICQVQANTAPVLEGD